MYDLHKINFLKNMVGGPYFTVVNEIFKLRVAYNTSKYLSNAI